MRASGPAELLGEMGWRVAVELSAFTRNFEHYNNLKFRWIILFLQILNWYNDTLNRVQPKLIRECSPCPFMSVWKYIWKMQYTHSSVCLCVHTYTHICENPKLDLGGWLSSIITILPSESTSSPPSPCQAFSRFSITKWMVSSPRKGRVLSGDCYAKVTQLSEVSLIGCLFTLDLWKQGVVGIVKKLVFLMVVFSRLHRCKSSVRSKAFRMC